MNLAAIIANLPALVVVVPLLLAPVAALIPVSGAAWVIAVIGTGGALISAWMLQGAVTGGVSFSYHLGSWPPPWGIEFVVDAASALTVLIMAALALLPRCSRRALPAEINERMLARPIRPGCWHRRTGRAGHDRRCLQSVCISEISALSSIILIALGAGTDRRALVAAYNYLIGAVGATFYVIGVGFIYAVTGTWNILTLRTDTASAAGYRIIVGFGFMVAGILVKAAAFPVHIWLPAAYAFAPSAVSAMLAAIATKAALYILARILFTVFAGVPDVTAPALEWVLILAIAGIFTGTILAIYENDIKKLLAFSSVAQIGYIALAFGIAAAQASPPVSSILETMRS